MSPRLYSVLLLLYPAELRRNFGAEMTQVFLEDLEESQRRSGIRGSARVWWRSIRELFRIALPARVSGREIIVALITYAFSESYFLGIVMLDGGKHIPRPPELEGASLLAWGLFPAFTAYVALCVGNRTVPEPLDLRRTDLKQA